MTPTADSIARAIEAHRQTYTDNLAAATAAQKESLRKGHREATTFWSIQIVRIRDQINLLDSVYQYAKELEEGL